MGNINDYGFPFSSVSNDRQYSAAEWRDYFGTLIKDGVVQNALNECQVKPQAVPNKTVFVDTGTVLIRGAMRILETVQALSIDDNTSGISRIDRIVARLNFTDRKIEFAVLKGTPASSPEAPSLTRNSSVWELALADITLANGFSSIIGTAIIDKRQEPDLCGASSITIGVIPPSGADAETVMLSAGTAAGYSVGNVDGAINLLKRAKNYGKYSQMSGGSAKVGSAQAGAISFSTEDNDDFNAIDIAVSQSRISVPAGVSKVKFYWSGTLNGGRPSCAIRLHKNGSQVGTFFSASSSLYLNTTYSGSFETTVMDCTAGDYFEVYAATTTDSGDSSVAAGSIFGMEVIA